MDKNYWVVRLGEANKFAEICHKKDMIAVGWSELDLDLSAYAHLEQRDFTEEISKKLGKVIKDKSEKSLAGWARQLYKFSVLMKPGDIILSPSNNKEGLRYLGIVRSDYYYDAGSADIHYRHRRNVEWIAELDKSTFSEGLQNSSGAIMTVFSVSKYAEEIEQLLQGKVFQSSILNTGELDLKEFGMESHLEDFIVENWDSIDAFTDYEIYKEEDGEIIGQQYVTDIGRIDILARSKKGKDWLVIELKKGKTSDDVVGQTLRYIGWIQKNEAGEGERVKGLIISGEEDVKLGYALYSIDHIGFMTYKVKFSLEKLK